MKTKHLFFLLAWMLIIPAMINAQDTLRNQIMNYEQSKHDFLDKGRRMLLDNFEQHNLQKVKEIKDLLLKENDGNIYHTFFPIEYVHLLYWTEEYKELTDFIKQADYRAPVSRSVSILAQVDNLYPTLLKKTAESKDVLDVAIKTSSESQMDKDFLLLYLEDILRAGQGRHINYESVQTERINTLSDAFLANYPGSPYENIVKETIRFRFEPSPWALYWDMFGIGAVIPSGNLSNYFDPGGTFEMAFDVRYKKLVGILGFGFSQHKLKQDILINNVTWNKGSTSSHGIFHLNAGYLLLENERFNIYPFVGIGYNGISAIQKDIDAIPELDKTGLNTFFSQVGIGFDFKFKFSTPYDDIAEHPDMKNSRISVRYSFRKPQFEKKYTGMDGSTHSIVVSWGLGGRPPRRVK